MFAGWYLGLIGGLLVGIIFCGDNNPLSIDNEPDAQVILSVDTRPQSEDDLISLQDDQPSEPFTCFECMNCNQTSSLTTRVCSSDVNMCYTIHKRINNTNQITHRGCSTLKGSCAVPDHYQLKVFDSITCCPRHKCNESIQIKPLVFLLILNLFIIMLSI